MYDILDAVRIQAMRATIRPDEEAIIRKICRWYSREFNTPLHTLDELPIEYILLHYFEEMYEKLKPEERHDLAVKIIETAEEKEIREAEEKKSEEELIEMAKADNDRINAFKLRAKQSLDSLKEIDSVGPNVKAKPKKPNKIPKLAIPSKEDEVIVSFEEKLDSELEKSALGPPPKKRR